MEDIAVNILSHDEVKIFEAAEQAPTYLCQAKARGNATDQSDGSFDALIGELVDILDN